MKMKYIPILLLWLVSGLCAGCSDFFEESSQNLFYVTDVADLDELLVGEAYRQGRTHLFLYTKPETAPLFSSLGFYPLITTQDMAMLESRKGGLEAYLAGLQRGQGVQGACVMNASPFTLGHRYLLETAARQVDTLHVFIVSQDNGPFSPALRREMAQAGAADIPNILWQDCGSYLVSAATFPTYFIKDRARAEDAQADLDIALFAQKIAPTLSITRRFVGTEPFCPITARYHGGGTAPLRHPADPAPPQGRHQRQPGTGGHGCGKLGGGTAAGAPKHICKIAKSPLTRSWKPGNAGLPCKGAPFPPTGAPCFALP